MVALFTSESLASESLASEGFVPSFGPRSAIQTTHDRSARPNLRLIEGGACKSRSLPSVSSTTMAALFAGFLMLLTVLAVRFAQVPSEQVVVAMAEARPAPTGLEGESTITVELGQNMWDVARSIQSTGDLQIIVSSLAERNGGVDVLVGQVVIIPIDLLG